MTYGTPNSDFPSGGDPSRPLPPPPDVPPYPSGAPNPYAAPGYQGAPPPPPGGYPYKSGYPGPMAPSTSGWAIASLVCAIAGFFGFFVIGHILGVVFGHMALNEIKRSDGRLEGHGLAMAGLIISYISLGLIVVGILLFVIIFIIVGVAASQGGTSGILHLLG